MNLVEKLLKHLDKEDANRKEELGKLLKEVDFTKGIEFNQPIIDKSAKIFTEREMIIKFRSAVKLFDALEE